MIDPTNVRTELLDNGITLLTERIPTMRSASVGVWVQRGSRDEVPEKNGVAHFVEHMLFKGTQHRSTREIALEIDRLGGNVDAFTGHEISGYTAQVLDADLPEAFGLLAELATAPRFDPEELERERGVILEEIAAAEDDPEDVLFEAFQRRFWDGHAFGRPILGTTEQVASFDRDDLQDWMDGIGPADLVISAAGNLEHQRVADLVREGLGALAGGRPRPERSAPACTDHLEAIERDLEQIHLYVATPGLVVTDEERYAAHLLNTLLGGGVSSRLFHTIREEHGLAYNVYSSMASYSDTGYAWIGAGTRPQSAERVFELIESELARVRDEPVALEELERTKQHVKGSLMLSLESTFARMANLARQQIGFGRTFDLDEILAGIDSVSVEQIQACAGRLFAGRLSAGCIGAAGAVESAGRRLHEHPRFAV